MKTANNRKLNKYKRLRRIKQKQSEENFKDLYKLFNNNMFNKYTYEYTIKYK